MSTEYSVLEDLILATVRSLIIFENNISVDSLSVLRNTLKYMQANILINKIGE
jgi:hypothetical protein